MRKLVLAAFSCAVVAVIGVSAQSQAPTYRSHVRVLAASGPSLQVLTEPDLRSRAGIPGTLNVPDIQLEITPEPLYGKILLHVVAGPPNQRVKFDVIAGPGVLTPVVALRSENGTWLHDQAGRQLYLQLQAETVSGS